MAEEDISGYAPTPLRVIGIDIAEGARTASLLVENAAGDKLALQLDMENLLRAFEYLIHAVNAVGHNVTGQNPHFTIQDLRAAQIDQGVAAALSFGSIGLFCMILSDSQAEELGRKLLSLSQRTSSSTKH